MGTNLKRLILAIFAVLVPLAAEAQVGYWTQSAADPVTCNAGNKAAYYFNNATNKFRVCDGTAWADLGAAVDSDNVVEKSIALTSDQPNPAPATVTATWVTATSKIICGVLGTTADGLTPETINVAKLGVSVENRILSTSFDIRIENFYGLEGTVRIHCIGR